MIASPSDDHVSPDHQEAFSGVESRMKSRIDRQQITAGLVTYGEHRRTNMFSLGVNHVSRPATSDPGHRDTVVNSQIARLFCPQQENLKVEAISRASIKRKPKQSQGSSLGKEACQRVNVSEVQSAERKLRHPEQHVNKGSASFQPGFSAHKSFQSPYDRKSIVI